MKSISEYLKYVVEDGEESAPIAEPVQVQEPTTTPAQGPEPGPEPGPQPAPRPDYRPPRAWTTYILHPLFLDPYYRRRILGTNNWTTANGHKAVDEYVKDKIKMAGPILSKNFEDECKKFNVSKEFSTEKVYKGDSEHTKSVFKMFDASSRADIAKWTVVEDDGEYVLFWMLAKYEGDEEVEDMFDKCLKK